MRSYTPDKRSMNVLRAASAAAAVILIAAARFLISIYALMMTLTVFFAVSALIIMFVYLPMYFSGLAYTVNKSEIRKKSGAFFKKEQTVKFSSIQYSSVITTPFSEYTGLNFIVFYVYGGRIFLMYLKKSDINEILALSGSAF